MDRLCDEIIRLIFFELNDPTAFTIVCKRFHHFSQDPYVRAHYFLTRHGPTQAMYWAFGRGKLITGKVLDILLASGAHLSRYFVQVATHHYFRTTSHFIKTQWARSIPVAVFSYFLIKASELYEQLPLGKGEDDGSIFNEFLKESRYPSAMKNVSWEDIRCILVKYKFIPFSHKDPIMATFPLALAVEPKLLPFAIDNGFRMDSKYRDFVFRKMFERPAMFPSMYIDARTEETIHNVRELGKLDPTMFVSRTVAAEVCMEAKTNESAYAALRRLDKAGELRFDLSSVVEELIKLFVKTRSIMTHATIQVLRQLHADFPSTDPTVRVVILLTVFLSDNCLAHTTPGTLKSKLEPLGLTPLSKKDIFNILTNPFVERYGPIIDYARIEVGLSEKEVRELVEEIAVKCLEIECKGKTLKKLFEGFPSLQESIATVVPQRYQIELHDLPQPDDVLACKRYEAKLCRDYVMPKFYDTAAFTLESDIEARADDRDDSVMDQDEAGVEGGGEEEAGEHSGESDETTNPRTNDLGQIGQDTLTAMIRRDEIAPTRTRRRAFFGAYSPYGEMAGKLHYPQDAVQVGRWIKEQYGARGRTTAIFMSHAIVNENNNIIHHYLSYSDGAPRVISNHVPVTLKHFKLLARLGRAPSWCLYQEIELGAEFYFSEEDYLAHQDLSDFKRRNRIKVEPISAALPSASSLPSSPSPFLSRGKKRPRRATTSARSYIVPDSDDEAIVDEGVERVSLPVSQTKKSKKVETNHQLWLKHLTILLKEEQRKYKEKKKRSEKSAVEGTKVRVPKSEFFKSLSTNLRNLRKIEREGRLQLYGTDYQDEEYTDGDDEYRTRTTRNKRRAPVV